MPKWEQQTYIYFTTRKFVYGTRHLDIQLKPRYSMGIPCRIWWTLRWNNNIVHIGGNIGIVSFVSSCFHRFQILNLRITSSLHERIFVFLLHANWNNKYFKCIMNKMIRILLESETDIHPFLERVWPPWRGMMS